MFTYYKQAYVCLLSMWKAYACVLIMSKGYTCLLHISKGLRKIIQCKQSLCIFTSYEHGLHTHTHTHTYIYIYIYILIDSISEVYTYVLFDVVSVNVYLCTLYTVYVPVTIWLDWMCSELHDLRSRWTMCKVDTIQ